MKQKKELVVILDNIRSLYNVGSIFRTAEALGFKKVYLGGITPAPNNEKNIKAINKTAINAEKYLDWEKSHSILKILKKLKEKNYYLIALEINKNSTKINQFKKWPKKYQKIALIVGNERKGINKKYLNYCDKILEIPLVGQKESLNVSVAFGIAAFWLKNLNKL